MNQKTKDKIEDLNKKRSHPGWDYDSNFRKLYRDGATPWAEWCERLLLAANCDNLIICDPAKDNQCYSCKISDEFEQWLEGKHEQG